MFDHPPHPRLGHLGAGRSWAQFSPCRTYRYRLGRVWDPGGPVLGWVILHGSGADEHRNDPVVRRCAGFARAWGYGGVDIAALYALVAADPAALSGHADPVGPGNDAQLAALADRHDLIMLAWGDADPVRTGEVARQLRRGAAGHGGSLAVLGWTPQGQPCHVLDAADAALPECFTPPTADWPPPRCRPVADRRWALLVGSAA